jgi:hypothetical protein
MHIKILTVLKCELCLVHARLFCFAWYLAKLCINLASGFLHTERLSNRDRCEVTYTFFDGFCMLCPQTYHCSCQSRTVLGLLVRTKSSK